MKRMRLFLLSLSLFSFSIFWTMIFINFDSCFSEKEGAKVSITVDDIPLWHFKMIQDQKRNDAFYNALKDVIKPNESIILDLGSGTGLLSLFAYTLGAKQVTAVEKSSLLASLSMDILRVNNFPTERIHVLNIHSSELKVGYNGYYQSKASILVSETLDSWIVGEGFLDSLLDLRVRKVINKDTIVIPNRATVYLQLVQTYYLFPTEIPQIRNINFKPVLNIKYYDGIVDSVHRSVAINLSDIHHMFDFNFQDYGINGYRPIPYNELFIPITESGILHGLAAWFNTCLDSNCKYSMTNAPNSTNHWDQMIRLFCSSDNLYRVEKGDTIHLLVAQVSQRYVFGLADYGERILKFQSICELPMTIYQENSEFGYVEENFPLYGYGDFNLWLANVSQTFIAIVYYDSKTVQCDDYDNCAWEREVLRVTVPFIYNKNFTSVSNNGDDGVNTNENMNENENRFHIPLYEYLISC